MVLLGKRRAVDDNLARGRLLKKVNATNHGRLARARRANYNNLLALLDRQVDVLQDMQVTKVFVETLNFNHVGHGWLPFLTSIREAYCTSAAKRQTGARRHGNTAETFLLQTRILCQPPFLFDKYARMRGC